MQVQKILLNLLNKLQVIIKMMRKKEKEIKLEELVKGIQYILLHKQAQVVRRIMDIMF